MESLEQIQRLNAMLLAELPACQRQARDFPQDTASQRRLLRGLMNLRPPMPLAPEFLVMQDRLLSAEREDKGVVEGAALPAIDGHSRIVVWKGDITRLKVNAIVNAANSTLLGCFCPCHGCIDNAIHSAAGLQLRDECNRIMQARGHSEPTGRAKLTKGYNLPAQHVIHTVGPIIQNHVTRQEREELASCYRSCLGLAAAHGLKSVAFCCISTGEFHFPNQEAAEIAVKTVAEFLQQDKAIERVIFNVFKDVDETIYRRILSAN